MPRDPDLVYIPPRPLEDRHLTDRDLEALFRLLILAESGQCAVGPEDPSWPWSLPRPIIPSPFSNAMD